MAVVILLLAEVVRYVAMPALAGLLIVVGIGTVRPARVMSVARTGNVPLAVMTITLVLTMIVPLQYSVLVGVGISIILYVAGQSSRLVTRRLVLHDDGRVELTDPPSEVATGEVVVLQPYGAVFFATAQTLRDQLPTIAPSSRHAVVVLRIRGADDVGSTVMDVLARYAARPARGRQPVRSRHRQRSGRTPATHRRGHRGDGTAVACIGALRSSATRHGGPTTMGASGSSGAGRRSPRRRTRCLSAHLPRDADLAVRDCRRVQCSSSESSRRRRCSHPSGQRARGVVVPRPAVGTETVAVTDETDPEAPPDTEVPPTSEPTDTVPESDRRSAGGGDDESASVLTWIAIGAAIALVGLAAWWMLRRDEEMVQPRTTTGRRIPR